MRLFVKLMALVLIAAVAGLFFVKTPDGQPILKFDSISASISAGGANLKRALKNLGAVVTSKAGGNNADQTELYRWQDRDGQWHYSDAPPPEGDSQVIVIDPNVNRMDAIPVSRQSNKSISQPTRSNEPVVPAPVVLSPASIPKAINEAHKAREQIEARDEAIRKLSEAP